MLVGTSVQRQRLSVPRHDSLLIASVAPLDWPFGDSFVGPAFVGFVALAKARMMALPERLTSVVSVTALPLVAAPSSRHQLRPSEVMLAGPARSLPPRRMADSIVLMRPRLPSLRLVSARCHSSVSACSEARRHRLVGNPSGAYGCLARDPIAAEAYVTGRLILAMLDCSTRVANA